jgi:hypothetical protein
MRAYIPVAPEEIERFAREGNFRFASAYALTPLFSKANLGADEEEMEFELSYLAAQASKVRLAREDENGFALAVDLLESQKGAELEETVELVTALDWLQVDSLLVAHSEEDELTWYGAQEVPEELAKWLA